MGDGPPLVTEVVYVTGVPAQTVLPGLAVIVTIGVTDGVTVIVIELLVAVVGLAHDALLVSTHLITSLLDGV